MKVHGQSADNVTEAEIWSFVKRPTIPKNPNTLNSILGFLGYNTHILRENYGIERYLYLYTLGKTSENSFQNCLTLPEKYIFEFPLTI